MKKYLILLLAIILFACAPKKIITATKTEQSTNVQSAIVDTNNSAKKEVKTKTEVSDTGTEITVKITVYDQKRDSLTGKQLIKSETVKTTKKAEKKEAKTVIDSENKEASTHADNSTVNNTVKAETIVKEIPKTPAVKYWFYIIVLVLVVVGLLFARKYWVVIKAFLGLK